MAGNWGEGMFYILTEIVLILAFLMLPRHDEKQNIVICFPIAVVAYECLACFWTGLLTILYINTNINSAAVCNLALCAYLVWLIWKKQKVQKYNLAVSDTVFLLVYTVVIFWAVRERFTPELLIRFETSDPGVHLKSAMDFVNGQRVKGMYLGAATNGLFIQSMTKIWEGVQPYKFFLIKYGINFYFSGLVFASGLIGYAHRIWMKMIVYVAVFFYVFGYPYNDMVFGFVYLQLTVTVIAFLCVVSGWYIDSEGENKNIYGVLLALGCLGTGIGYTLFAPAVYAALLACIVYKAYKEGWLLRTQKRFFSTAFIKEGLRVFLVPTVMTLWFLVIAPLLARNPADYGNALTIEGYIYRNLYSDFWLYIIFAVYAVYVYLKKKKINLPVILLVIGTGYAVFFFIKMLQAEVSTYYYYKLNYMLWMLVLSCFVIGVLEFLKKERFFGISYLAGIAMLAVIMVTGAEGKWREININNLPFADTGAFFHIYSMNQMLHERASGRDVRLVKICEKVKEDYSDAGEVLFIGHFENMFWFEALTDQRISSYILWKLPEEVMEKYKQGQYGKYMVVAKESEEYLSNAQLYDELERVYEDEYAFIGIWGSD